MIDQFAPPNLVLRRPPAFGKACRLHFTDISSTRDCFLLNSISSP